MGQWGSEVPALHPTVDGVDRNREATISAELPDGFLGWKLSDQVPELVVIDGRLLSFGHVYSRGGSFYKVSWETCASVRMVSWWA